MYFIFLKNAIEFSKHSFDIVLSNIPTMQTAFQALLVLAATSCSIICSSCGSKGNNSESRSPVKAAQLVVNGIVVHPQPLDNIVRSSGTVLASESVDLVAESAGRVDKISFREGKHVRKDDMLVKINDDDLQAQLKKTELQIQLA